MERFKLQDWILTDGFGSRLRVKQRLSVSNRCRLTLKEWDGATR